MAELNAPDPFIIQKSRQLNRRVTLNVGGIRHEVGWQMLEQVSRVNSFDADYPGLQVPRSRLGKLVQAGTHEQILALCDTYRSAAVLKSKCFQLNFLYFQSGGQRILL